MTKTETLDTLLEGYDISNISDFNRRFVETCDTNEENIRHTYEILKRIGLTNNKIATHSFLLGMNPETIERNYQVLKKLGLKDDKIATYAQLLGRNPETIERNYQRLSALGLKEDKIASQAHLLGMNPETIERNYQRLSALGLKDKKIVIQAQLLGMNPETIERNYQHHVILLRQDHKNRNSGKDLLINQVQLLEIPSETIESNIQYLHSIGIDYNNNILLLGTTSKLKRKKMAYLLREIFDYRNLSDEEKPNAIRNLYDLVRKNPRYLINSISTLEKEKKKIKQKFNS